MKVHVVTAANRGHYAGQLEQMHRQRYEVFVRGLGWSDLANGDGLERDQFDEEAAVYLLACDEDAVVQGSLRLLPTWRRCMLTECWPEFVTRREAPKGHSVWEWTRWCPGTLARPRALIRARKALIVGALEFAAAHGVETYLTFCDTKFLGQLVELGWAPDPLGLPGPYEQGMAIGVSWKVEEGLLQRTRALLRLDGPVSVDRASLPPLQGPWWAGRCRAAHTPGRGGDFRLAA